MGQLLNLVTPLHEQTKRDYVARMLDDKVHCMKRAREYEFDYWDGDRRYGYGGYRYIPGRWKPVAKALIERYDLKPGDSVLDLGCGKAHLLYEMQLLMPKLRLHGVDRSHWSINSAPREFEGHLFKEKLQDFLETCGTYTLMISLGAFHNLTLREMGHIFPNLGKVAKNAYIMVESYRNEQELFNLQCWCLTAETLLRPEDWIYFYNCFGYKGDFEFIYFQ